MELLNKLSLKEKTIRLLEKRNFTKIDEQKDSLTFAAPEKENDTIGVLFESKTKGCVIRTYDNYNPYVRNFDSAKDLFTILKRIAC